MNVLRRYGADVYQAPERRIRLPLAFWTPMRFLIYVNPYFYSAAAKEHSMALKRIALISIALLFLIPMIAAADISNPTPVPDPGCGDVDPYNGCHASTTSTHLTCTDSWGCLMCGLSPDSKTALCYRQINQIGYCSCKPLQVVYQAGVAQPQCTHSGFCTVRQ